MCDLDDTPLAPGRFARADLLIDQGESLALLDYEARESARRVGAVPAPAPPTGWCSWYLFYESVTEADAQRYLDFIADHDLPLRTLYIDSGWEQSVDDWQPNKSLRTA